ncbi:P-loop containing nucleoside triphosphate hydrolase protein [Chytriomyces sp. MP71]|nr:P-loop containing nucleoside triphosphate hydrolase protein [Chytriomyces sp. MP71]
MLVDFEASSLSPVFSHFPNSENCQLQPPTRLRPNHAASHAPHPMSSSAKYEKPADVKVILLGDSAVGKSKLTERFLLNDFVPHQLSTYALTLYRHQCPHPTTPSKTVTVEIWDTAGQERFHAMHPSYYLGAHAAILCFDMTRKITYKNLDAWFDKLSAFRGLTIPVVVVANKVDMDPARARKSFGFVERRREERRAALEACGKASGAEDMPLFMCSASDGTNVVAAFREAIQRAVEFKEGGEKGATFVDEILNFIREEEQAAGGLFSNRDESEGLLGTVGVQASSESVRDSGSTLYLSETARTSASRFDDSRAMDSDEEDGVVRAKTLARLQDIRKANLVTQ